MPLYKNVINSRTGTFNLVPSFTIVRFKTAVALHANLPLSGNTLGDARVAEDTQHVYIWSNDSGSGILTDWTDQGLLVDLGDLAEVEWDSILNKPSSTPAEIDSAVSLKHTQNTDAYLVVSSVEIVNDETTFTDDNNSSFIRASIIKATRNGTLSKLSFGIYPDSISGTTGHLLIELRAYTSYTPINDHQGNILSGSILETKQVAVTSLINGWNDVTTGWATNLVKDTQYVMTFTLVGDCDFTQYRATEFNDRSDNVYFASYASPNTWYFNDSNQTFQIKHYITVLAGDLIENGLLVSDLLVDNLIKIDGRDLSVDGLKLDGIEDNAVALATVKGDTDVSDAISLKHTQNSDVDTTVLINTPDLSGSSDYTLVLSDKGKFIDLDKATSVTLTIPLTADVDFPIGTSIFIRQKGVGEVTIQAAVAASGEDALTLDTEVGLVLNAQFAGAFILKINTDTWAIFGSLKAS